MSQKVFKVLDTTDVQLIAIGDNINVESDFGAPIK